MIGDLAAARELSWRLFVRDLSAKYRQTVLGYVWALLPALITTFIWVFLNRQKILNIGRTDIPYPAYVLIGTLLWQVFVDALRTPLQKATAARAMLVKINFPREAVLIAGLGEVVFNFLIKLILVIAVFVYFKIPVQSTILLFPLGVIALILLGTTLGVLLIPIGLLYKDVSQSILLVTQLWFYVTPIIYPVPKEGLGKLVATVNPVSPILIMTRSWLTGTSGDALQPFIYISLGAMFLLVSGWMVYRLALPHLIERMSA
jgi:lipopolysaccharide transport system permease protein